MNNKTIASLVFLAPLMLGQMALAGSDTSLTQQTKPQVTQQPIQQVSISDLLEAKDDYVLDKVERPKTRRSALFANVLDAMAKNATLA